MLTTLNGLLIGLVCLTTLAVMVMWHVTGRGAWRRYSSGAAVMGLLGVITAITGLACVSTFVGPYPLRAEIYGVLYSLLLVVIVLIGATIIGAQKSAPPISHEEDDER